ncbi:hypothetical protein MUY27_00115 [Mucilaginibacter sp. RS28]|uniref:Uncharacterized protein n=1 Tax=Mucilaginibacter straminoryzae TaxID=2932774 RepID=A0A9X1WZ40_9SPHI|nr:hypothetical protein [Mucilaginibacter straminoryzae]MCJ8208088.1 hypothetical protein [Mucilaginibacter straminoryzae]
MAFIRIPLAIIALILICGSSSFGQKKPPVSIVDSLYDVSNKLFTPDKGSKRLYIIYTYKNCSHCFADLCDKIAQSEFKDYTLYIVGVTHFDLLNLRPMAASIREQIPCTSKVLFFFNDAGQLPEICETPTPQFITSENGNLRYFNYGKTLKFIETGK